MINSVLRPLFNPELYHGRGVRKNFFEGWYFRIADREGKHLFAFIPGVSFDSGGSKHAFIQVMKGEGPSSEYHRFGFESFSSLPDRFKVMIGDNSFAADALSVDLPGIEGTLRFSGSVKWPSPWYSPGVMGPYSFVPFMECNHGILSMYHTIEGELEIAGRRVDFTGGRGYTEKDWGRSFPEAYIWMQGNHFDDENISFKLSIARIPWVRNSFTGFIGGIWLNGDLVRFTTYNSSRLKKLTVSNNEVMVLLENRQYTLQICCSRPESAKLASPVMGEMSGHIHETMTAVATLQLSDNRSGKILFEGRSRNSALEVAGNTGLLKM